MLWKRVEPLGRPNRPEEVAESHLLERGNIAFTFLRPNLYMQGLLNFRQRIQPQHTFFAATGDARSSAVDVRDLAIAVL